MQTKTKIIAAALLLTTAVASYAMEADSYTQIKQMIEGGSNPTFVMNFAKCQGAEYPTEASLTPHALMLANNQIITSDREFTTMDPKAPGVPVYENMVYQINSDNSVTMTATVYNAINFQPVATIPTVTCQLGDGFNVYFH